MRRTSEVNQLKEWRFYPQRSWTKHHQFNQWSELRAFIRKNQPEPSKQTLNNSQLTDENLLTEEKVLPSTYRSDSSNSCKKTFLQYQIHYSAHADVYTLSPTVSTRMVVTLCWAESETLKHPPYVIRLLYTEGGHHSYLNNTLCMSPPQLFFRLQGQMKVHVQRLNLTAVLYTEVLQHSLQFV